MKNVPTNLSLPRLNKGGKYPLSIMLLYSIIHHQTRVTINTLPLNAKRRGCQVESMRQFEPLPDRDPPQVRYPPLFVHIEETGSVMSKQRRDFGSVNE